MPRWKAVACIVFAVIAFGEVLDLCGRFSHRLRQLFEQTGAASLIDD